MKKLAKYLVLFLVIAALVGVFAFAASADNAQGTTGVVGSYTVPEDAWVPSGDYATISYGAWATENDYLTGADPAVWYSTDSEAANYAVELTVERVGAYAYVHIFTDSVTINTKTVYNPTVNQTVNLGGHTIGTAESRQGAFGSRVATVTIKNGIYYNAAHMQGYNLMVLDNVHFISNYSSPFYGFTGDLTLKNSIMDWDGAASSSGVFFMDNWNKNDTRKLIVENTDIILTSVPHADAGLFGFYTRDGYNGGFDVLLDKNSSITGNLGVLAAVRDIHTPEVSAGSFEIYIEEGFEFVGSAQDCLTTFKYHMSGEGYVQGDSTLATSYLQTHIVKNTNNATDFTAYEKLEWGKDTVYLTENGDNYIVSASPLATAAWYVLGEGELFAYGAAPVIGADGKATLTKNDIMSFPEGATVLFAQDIATNFEDSNEFFFANDLVIDLNGNTLYAAHKWNMGNADVKPALNFTLKNGNVVSSNTQVFMGHPGDAGVITFEDVNFTNNYAREVIHLYSGILNVTRCTFTGNDLSRTGDSVAIRLSTKGVKTLNLVESTIVGYNGVRMDANSEGGKITVNVTNSTIEAQNAAFIIRDGETATALSGGVEINVSKSKVKAPVFVAELADGASYPAIDAPVNVTVSETYLSVVPVYTTANNVVTLNYAAGEVIYEDTTVEGYAYLVRPKKEWVPGAGITFAVWSNENSFKAGDDPVSSSDVTTLNSTITKGWGNAYVRIYAEVTYLNGTSDTEYTTGSNQHLVIDFAGSTITAKNKIRLSSNSTLTLKNTENLFIGGQIQLASGSVLTFDNVEFKRLNDYATQLGYNQSGSIVIKDSIVHLGHASPFTFGPATNQAYITIENSDIYFESAGIPNDVSGVTGWSKAGLFSFLHNVDGRTDVNISIDGESSFTSTVVKNPIWFAFTHSAGTIKNVGVPTITIEEGFTFNGNVAPNFNYVYMNSTTGGVYLDSTAEVGEGVTKNECLIKIVDSNGNEITGQLYANATETANVYAISGKPNFTEWTSYYVIEKDSTARILFGTKKTLASDGVTALFTQKDVTSLAEYATLLFAQDMILESRVQSYGVKRADHLTFDLGGNTFYLNAAFDLEYYDTSIGGRRPTNSVFKNGTIEIMENGKFGGFGEVSSVYRFEKIHFVQKINKSAIAIYCGTVELINCTSDSVGTIVGFDPYAGYHCIRIDGCNFVCRTVVSLPYSSGGTMNLGYEDCYIKNSVFNTSSNAVSITQKGTAGTALNLDFVGNTVYGNNIISVGADMVGSVNVRVSDCYFGTENILVTTSSADLVKVIYADGETKMGVEGMDDIACYVGKKPTVASGAFRSNLTLYTDFTLNFFANPEVITALYANGEALTAETFENLTKYSIRGISAANAADAIELVVWIKSGDVTYKVPVSYSVLTYANSVIAKDDLSDLSKQLVTSAMEYVKAAYTYTGKTAPAFTGVAIDAATAPATTAVTLPELIAGAQLSLGENLKLRFTLAEGKSGNLTVGDASYVVENGKVGEVGYVEVDMRAYLFYDAEIVVSDGTTTGTYTLAHYVNAVKGNADANLVDLVNDFYTYTKYASDYKKTGSLN